MLNLASTSDILRVVTGSAVSTIGVHASWVDLNGTTVTPDRKNTNVTTATTTTVVPSPAASTVRNVIYMMISNNSATQSTTVSVQHYDGTTSVDLIDCTLLPGENLALREDGSFVHRDANGAEYQPWMPNDYQFAFGIAGTLAESMPRMLCNEANLSALTSGTLHLTAVYLKAGMTVTNLSFFSATTAAGTPTNGMFSLYDGSRNLLAQTANFTTEAWAANTIKTKALTAPYKITSSGIYYIGILITATTAPTLKGLTGKTGGQLAGTAPILHGNSSSGLTTSLPNPAAAITVSTSMVWCAAT